MAENTQGLVTLDYVVASVMNELKSDERDYEYLLQLAIDGFRELTLFNLNTIRVAYLTLDSNNVANLPIDYNYYTMIGIVVGGQLYTLTKNDNIPLIRETECGLDVNPNMYSSPLQVQDGYWVVGHDRNGTWIPKLYARGGGYNIAYYRIDEERRQVIIQGAVANNEIVMEYVATGINLNGETYVKMTAIPALKAYVHWKRVQFDPRIDKWEKVDLRNEYRIEESKLGYLEKTPTLQELADAWDMESRQSPKR